MKKIIFRAEINTFYLLKVTKISIILFKYSLLELKLTLYINQKKLKSALFHENNHF